MFITPIQKISGIGLSQLDGIAPAAVPAAPMNNFFQDILQNVIDTDNAVASDVQALATGQTDDLHNLTINQTKAELSIQLLVQMRNRLMDAYSEIMRINL